jgi:hypothetical protein
MSALSTSNRVREIITWTEDTKYSNSSMLSCVEPMDPVGPSIIEVLRRFIDTMDVGSFDFLCNMTVSLSQRQVADNNQRIHNSRNSFHTGVDVLGFVVVTYGCCPANEISMNGVGLPKRIGIMSWSDGPGNFRFHNYRFWLSRHASSSRIDMLEIYL